MSLKKAANDLEAVRLKGELKRAKDELAKAHREHEKTIALLEKSRAQRVKAPKAKAAPKLKGDTVEVITGDWHGNKHDPQAWAAFLQDVKSIAPNRAILGGDIIDCGGYLASHYTLGYIAETEDSYEDDIQVANRMLDQFQEATSACETHYIEGNHEARVEKQILTENIRNHADLERRRRQDAAEYVLHVRERGFNFYSWAKVYEEGQTRGWIKLDKLLFTHKISNAKNAVRAALEKTAANVVFFDTHRAGYAPARKAGTGLIAAWNPGCLCKLAPLYSRTDFMEWNHGYLVRFISRTGNFQVVNIAIDEGKSFGSCLFNFNNRKSNGTA